ncbi:hypothetical protein ILUMI_20586 [Ignelater luminosus]|uniref:Uncharacterized protein n=1 Tax=Ignelater luminosus TaxID=2038154 RepID=A0A8K0G4Q3_IGNLU|nr:hypothetical protein ILUMI_20586 [Ignelater luminosus]
MYFQIANEHHIKIDKSVQPVVDPPRKVSISVQPKLKETLSKLEVQGVIAKFVYPADWANSMVIVEKKSGELRICLDPEDLNRAIEKEQLKI